jgi:diguanylate cyclase (GGDEF)-like protein
LSIAADELYSSLDSDQILQLGLQSAARLVCGDDPDAQALFFLIEHDRANLIASYSHALQLNNQTDSLINLLSLSLTEMPALQAAVVEHQDRDFDLAHDPQLSPAVHATLVELEATSGLARPVRIDGDIDGLLVVADSGRIRTYSHDQHEWLQRLCAILELALSRALIHERQTAIDSLTGLYNRNEFDKRLNTLPRGLRYSLVVIDVDRLKTMNDDFGHEAGDTLLKAIASAIKGSLRKDDIPGRLGGDEFAVILPGSDVIHAEAVAERILANATNHQVEGIAPSISLGVAASQDGVAAHERLVAADRAMYVAKRAGGHRVHRADVRDPLPPAELRPAV